MSNEYYDHGSFPAAGAAGSSAAMRAELDSIEAGFDKLPALTGNANKLVQINSAGTALEATTRPAGSIEFIDDQFAIVDNVDVTKKAVFDATGITTGTTRTFTFPNESTTLVGTGATQTLTNKTLTSPTISGGTIDNATIGATTRAAGNFTTLDANGNVVLGDAAADTVTINGILTATQTVAGNTRHSISNADTGAYRQTDLRIGRGTNAQDVFIGTNYTGTQGAFIDNRSGGSFSIMNTGTARLVLDSSGLTTLTGLSVTGATTLGDAAGDTVTINGTVQPGVAISGSSTGNALTITQTGTGNALVVEDSASTDSSPFVIDASGNVGIGVAAPTLALEVLRTGSAGMRLDCDGGTSTIQPRVFSNTAGQGPILNCARSRGTYASQAIVQSGDLLAQFRGGGWDGASFIQGANIEMYVDGTPGTNDMPGRLVFSTTADGASSPTERMRITSVGNVGVGGDPSTAATLYALKNPTGATTVAGVRSGGAIQSDVTTGYYGFYSRPSTQAATFTLTDLIHFYAYQSTIGAGSTVTNQYGYVASSVLTGATSNYGFYGDIASGTGRYNFYAAGTADNYFGGPTTVSTNSTSNALTITQTGTGNALVVEDAASDTTPFVIDASGSLTIGGAFTQALNNSITTGGTVTIRSPDGVEGGQITLNNKANTAAAYNFDVDSSDHGRLFTTQNNTNLSLGQLGGATGGIITLHTGSSERMRIDSAGNVGIGVTPIDKLNVSDGTATFQVKPLSGSSVVFAGTRTNHAFALTTNDTERMRIDSSGRITTGGITTTQTALALGGTNPSSGTGARSVHAVQTIPSNATGFYIGFHSEPTTQATSFTLAELSHFKTQPQTFGAGSSVTSQYGFHVDPALTGATNNYGFYSNIASGTGRWNFYAAGTAANYFGGDVLVGSTNKDTTGAVNAPFQLNATSGTNASLGQYAWNVASASAPYHTFNKSRGAAAGTRGAVASGDSLGVIYFAGDDSANFIRAAAILAEVDGTPGLNDMPGRLVFSTTADGASSPTERMRIDSSGNLLVGTTSLAASEKVFFNQSSDVSGEVLRLNHGGATATNQYGMTIRLAGDPNDATRYFYKSVGNATERATIRSNGGLANFSANDANLSDARLKTDFQAAPSYFDKWEQIDFVTYLYKDQTDAERNLGVTAQQLETVCPELIDNSGFGEAPEGEEPYKAVYQTDFQYATAKALQEAIAKIKQLESRLAALEAA